jgi:spore maturation protein CgeB
MHICLYRHDPRADVTLRILEAYQRAFERAGHRILVFSHEMAGFTPEEARAFARRFVEFKADFALCYGFSAMPRLNAGFFFRKHDIPLIILCFENPFFGLNPELVNEIQSHADHYYFFVWDTWYLDLLKRLFKHCHPIRHAAEIPRSHHTSGQACFPSRRNVTFVGHVPDFIAMRKARLNAGNPMNRLIDEVLLKKMRSPGANLFDLISAEAMNRPDNGNRHHDLDYLNPSLHKDLIYPVYAEGLGRYRFMLLNGLEGFDLHYYGDMSWKASHITFHTPVDYFEELPGVYRTSVVNIDIPPFQSFDSVDNRFFDVAAAGSLLLTRDSHDLASVYPDRASIVYDTLDDLKERIQYYLDHPAERDRVAAQLQACVFRHHTYDHRVDYILDTVGVHP